MSCTEKYESTRHEGVGFCRHISVVIISINILQACRTCEGVAERKPKEQQKLWNWFTFIFLAMHQTVGYLQSFGIMQISDGEQLTSHYPLRHWNDMRKCKARLLLEGMDYDQPSCDTRNLWVGRGGALLHCNFIENSLFFCNDKEAGEASGSILKTLTL